MVNVIPGTPDDDNLDGTQHKDKILGYAGDDLIYGKAGNDLIDAGPSTSYDDVYGGKGADTFRFFENYGVLQIEDFSTKDGDKLDLSHTGFEKSDLKDTETNDRDGDGYYLRQTSANGHPELQIFFHNGSGGTFDMVQLEDMTIKQFRHDVRDHPSHYDFA